MLNLASVRELNSRIIDKIPKLDIVRFRANIIRMTPASLCVTPTQSPPHKSVTLPPPILTPN